MNWYRKLTIDWPCKLGDWLWWAFVVMPATFLNELSFKRIVTTLGFFLLFYGFSQIFAFDLAITFATEALTYFDVASAILLIAFRDQARHVLRSTISIAKNLAIRMRAIVGTHVFRQSRRYHRQRKLLGRLFGKAKSSDEEHGASDWATAAFAF